MENSKDSPGRPTTSDTSETVSAFSLPSVSELPETDPTDVLASFSRRALNGLDKLEALATATENYITSNDLKPRDLADLIVAAGGLREKHINCAAKVIGDLTSSVRKKKVVKEA